MTCPFFNLLRIPVARGLCVHNRFDLLNMVGCWLLFRQSKKKTGHESVWLLVPQSYQKQTAIPSFNSTIFEPI